MPQGVGLLLLVVVVVVVVVVIVVVAVVVVVLESARCIVGRIWSGVRIMTSST